MRPAGLAATIIGLTFVAGSASAGAASGPYMAVGDSVAAPSGFQDMCRRGATFCSSVAAVPMTIPMSPANKNLLERVNREVNDAISEAEDQQTYGVPERWVNPLTPNRTEARGDCEDYALAKRDRLIAAGWPPGALFLAMGFHTEKGLHIVLIARTATGDLVMDSRTPWIERWDATPYIWVKRQVASNALQWVRPFQSVQAGRAPQTAVAWNNPRDNESRLLAP